MFYLGEGTWLSQAEGGILLVIKAMAGTEDQTWDAMLGPQPRQDLWVLPRWLGLACGHAGASPGARLALL